MITRNLFLICCIVSILCACDSRETFLKEFDKKNDFDISFDGDTLAFLGGSNQISFSLNFLNLPQETTNIELSVSIEGRGTLKLEGADTDFPLNTFVKVPKSIQFVLSSNEAGSNIIKFRARNVNIEKRLDVKFSFKPESNIISIDNSIAIDADSAKQGTEYAFKVFNNSQFPKKIKFLGINNGVWSFFLKNSVPLDPNIPLDNNEYLLGANANATFVAIAGNNGQDFLNTGIRIQSINLQNIIDDQKEIPILVFKNLPPIPSSVVAEQTFGTTANNRLEVFVKIISAIDGDAKWGGQVTQASFEGYKNAVYVDEVLEGNNYKFYYLEGKVYRTNVRRRYWYSYYDDYMPNDTITWRIGHKADEIGKTFLLNTNFDLFGIQQYAAIPAPYNVFPASPIQYVPAICISCSDLYTYPEYRVYWSTNGKMTHKIFARIGVIDNEGAKIIIEVPINFI